MLAVVQSEFGGFVMSECLAGNDASALLAVAVLVCACLCVCVHPDTKLRVFGDSQQQGHQGCVAWPGATTLQSDIRIWSGDALTTYLRFACDIMLGFSLYIVYPEANGVRHSLSLLLFTGYGVGLSQEPHPTISRAEHISQHVSICIVVVPRSVRNT